MIRMGIGILFNLHKRGCNLSLGLSYNLLIFSLISLNKEKYLKKVLQNQKVGI